jgi:glycine hydroxymethyltransferase
LSTRNKNIDGKKAAVLLEKAGIVVNANSIPHDPRPPLRPSGIRLGTPALTTRGMKEGQMEEIATWIERVISRPQEANLIRKEVKKLALRFPIYP